MRDQLDTWDKADVERLGVLLAKFNQALGEPQK
jgi:hypothetical protein